ncbi:MAG: hypothetical protein KKF00_09115 [Proteobacteria bacterium]|nr:hypothetical protein [Pseudomonadota bacterium]MBU1398540.1 hypothetical protein [Pseudomonadota bacterium]
MTFYEASFLVGISLQTISGFPDRQAPLKRYSEKDKLNENQFFFELRKDFMSGLRLLSRFSEKTP